MSAEIYPDLNEICRLCLADSLGAFNIFRSELSLPLRIMVCTTLEIKESDNLPPTICKTCRIELEKFYLFRKKCQVADKKLRKHKRLIKSGKVSKIFSTVDYEDEDDYDDDYLNSQKFISAFEDEILNQEEFTKKQNKMDLSQCHKYTQTLHKVENKCLINIGEKKLLQDFIDRIDEENNFENDIETEEKSDELLEKDEDKSNEIIYMLDNSGSDTEYDNKQEVEIYVEEEDESFYLKNDSNESKPQSPEKNDDSSEFIEDTCILEDMEENSNKMFDVSTSENEMILEKKTENINRDYQYDPDNEVFENKDVKLFKCHLCPQSFSRIFILDKHLNLHKKNKSHICSVCKKHFAAKSSLDRHSRIHNGEKPFKCDICGKAFVQNEILKRHRYLHFDKKPFECAHCDQGFIQKNLLQHHITMKHSNKPIPKMFNCDICPKSFVHSSGLSRHLILHSGIKYPCEYCKKSFTDKSALKRHKETHFKTKS